MQSFSKNRFLSYFWLIFFVPCLNSAATPQPSTLAPGSNAPLAPAVPVATIPDSPDKKDLSKKDGTSKESKIKDFRDSMMQDEAKIIGAVTSIKDLVAKSNINNAAEMVKQLDIILDVFKNRSEMHKNMQNHFERKDDEGKDGGIFKRGPKKGYGWPRRKKGKKKDDEKKEHSEHDHDRDDHR